jgi:hypothetical protein
MQTRSQTKKQEMIEEDRLPIYEVDIDFDGASKAWYMNKIALPNSTCKYICLGKTKSGSICKRTPIIYTNYCSCHKNLI